MFERAVLAVEAPQGFGVVRQAIETVFATPGVSGFLKSLERGSLRIRDFESVIRCKLLGETALTEYGRLGAADQGQLREFYLASLERVTPELRQKFFKLYAYY